MSLDEDPINAAAIPAARKSNRAGAYFGIPKTREWIEAKSDAME